MLTDEELTSQLKDVFRTATRDVSPPTGLGAAVRRRHRAARRRRVAVRIAVPAAAACAGGTVIVGSGLASSSHTPAAEHSTSGRRGTAGPASAISLVNYALTVPAEAGRPFTCLDPSAVQATHDGATWVAGRDNCTVIVVDTDTSLPADARPIDLAGVPGLYGTTDAATHAKTVYSHNPGGDWSALTVAADTPDQSLRGYYTPDR